MVDFGERPMPEYDYALRSEYPKNVYIIGRINQGIQNPEEVMPIAIKMRGRGISIRQKVHPDISTGYPYNILAIAQADINSIASTITIPTGVDKDGMREILQKTDSEVSVPLTSIDVLVLPQEPVILKFGTKKQTGGYDILSLYESFGNPIKDIEEFFSPNVTSVLRSYSQEFNEKHKHYLHHLQKEIRESLKKDPLDDILRDLGFQDLH